MEAAAEVERLAAKLAIAPKAALDGAKMVTSLAELTVLTRLVAFKAPTRAVKPAAAAVSAGLCGMVRILSMT